jgi:hypothetical protein
MLANTTGHHRAGTSRFPLHARQNISPASMSFPHHLHWRAGHSLLNILCALFCNGFPSSLGEAQTSRNTVPVVRDAGVEFMLLPGRLR